MKKSLALFLSAFFLLAAAIFIVGSDSVATSTSQANYEHQNFVPNELLVKLKEDVVGDIINNKELARNVFSQVQGRIKTYLNEETDACNWEPADFKNRSFFADPYLFHIRIPEGIGLDYAISRLR